MTHPLTIEPIDLAHGIRLECRVRGAPDAPVVVMLHGFPQGAFVWDALSLKLAEQGWRCVAPNLRGFAGSSQPAEPSAYRAKYLTQDIVELLRAQHPELMERFIAINSPHSATFLKALQADPEQQAASAYMHYLSREDAAERLSANGFDKLWGFLMRHHSQGMAAPAWLTPELKQAHEAIWAQGLKGQCAYYQQSPLKPPLNPQDAVMALELPAEMTHVRVPTDVIWGLQDEALRPSLLDGLSDHVDDVRIHRFADASHWVLHEKPDAVAACVLEALRRPIPAH
jgi:pimeloyl-ACP methyl ester carboxylesterase